MTTLKTIYIFVMPNTFFGFAKPKQFLSNWHHKGVVPLNSSDSNAVSVFGDIEGAMPYFFNFFKLFTNAKHSKQFIKRCKDYIFGNASYTKRSIAYLTRILKCTRFQVVQNSNQTKQSFNVFQRQHQPLSLWFGRRFVYSIQCFTSQGYQFNSLINYLFFTYGLMLLHRLTGKLMSALKHFKSWNSDY